MKTIYLIYAYGGPYEGELYTRFIGSTYDEALAYSRQLELESGNTIRYMVEESEPLDSSDEN